MKNLTEILQDLVDYCKNTSEGSPELTLHLPVTTLGAYNVQAKPVGVRIVLSGEARDPAWAQRVVLDGGSVTLKS